MRRRRTARPHVDRSAFAGFRFPSEVLRRQLSQQPEQEPTGPASGLDPTQPPRHPPRQPVSFGLTADRSYAVARGHRLIIRCRHN